MQELTELRPETRYGDSRFDFAFAAGEKRGFIEVKGVTLEENGVAYFPDAPTERGVKHVEELCRAAAEGYMAYLCFVVAMPGIHELRFNDRTHPAFEKRCGGGGAGRKGAGSRLQGGAGRL